MTSHENQLNLGQLWFTEEEKRITHDVIRWGEEYAGFPKDIHHAKLSKWSNEKNRYLEY